MLENAIVPLLFSLLIYIFLPKSETNLLVLLEMKTKQVKNEEINSLGNVRHLFEIIRNIDGHMKHVDTKGKASFNYAIISESDIEKFTMNLSKSAFVEKYEVFTFKTNPLMVMLANIWIKVKGFLSSSSLKASTEKIADISELCNEENFKNKSPKIMINIIKHNEKKKADFDEYSYKVSFGLFPVVKTNIFMAGSPTDDYWDQVALVEYANIEGLCNMAQSEEYMSVYEKKVAGLSDSHTYLTNQIF